MKLTPSLCWEKNRTVLLLFFIFFFSRQNLSEWNFSRKKEEVKKLKGNIKQTKQNDLNYTFFIRFMGHKILFFIFQKTSIFFLFWLSTHIFFESRVKSGTHILRCCWGCSNANKKHMEDFTEQEILAFIGKLARFYAV